MTALPFTLRVETLTSPVLFTVMGKLAPPSIEKARIVHNQAAGSDQAIAAARSLGDLSHAVFVPAEPDAPKDDFMIVDYWNSAAGIQMFFSDKHVQEGGAALFRERETVVWAGTPGLPRFALPAPTGRNDRFAGIIRGMVSSQKAAEKTLAEWMGKSLNQARARGLLSREFFFRHAPGGAPSLELIGLDVWFDGEGMQADYAEPAMNDLLGTLYKGEPSGGVYKKPKGQWVEW
jgi:hypothetical protein